MRSSARSWSGIARTWTAAALGTLCCLASAWAQETVAISTPQRAALERVAIARAQINWYADLTLLPLKPDLTLGQWCGRDVGLDRALRAWARTQPATRTPTTYGDGSCDAEVSVSRDNLVKQIAVWLEEFPRAWTTDSPSVGEIASASRDWQDVWANGTATLPATDVV